jgi:hypothetical protein
MEATIDEVKQGILILGGVIKLKQSVLFKDVAEHILQLVKKVEMTAIGKVLEITCNLVSRLPT